MVLVGIGIGRYWYWSVLVLGSIDIGRYWYWSVLVFMHIFFKSPYSAKIIPPSKILKEAYLTPPLPFLESTEKTSFVGLQMINITLHFHTKKALFSPDIAFQQRTSPDKYLNLPPPRRIVGDLSRKIAREILRRFMDFVCSIPFFKVGRSKSFCFNDVFIFHRNRVIIVLIESSYRFIIS